MPTEYIGEYCPLPPDPVTGPDGPMCLICEPDEFTAEDIERANAVLAKRHPGYVWPGVPKETTI